MVSKFSGYGGLDAKESTKMQDFIDEKMLELSTDHSTIDISNDVKPILKNNRLLAQYLS
jgi:hypothetical protein